MQHNLYLYYWGKGAPYSILSQVCFQFCFSIWFSRKIYFWTTIYIKEPQYYTLSFLGYVFIVYIFYWSFRLIYNSTYWWFAWYLNWANHILNPFNIYFFFSIIITNILINKFFIYTLLVTVNMINACCFIGCFTSIWKK